ncbi:peptidoglycan-binding protein [Candidatus Micrarchaeota archaeon]|nr:peptidoglycan-binding protein [Candidatus Micrarchaeota archaeon]
MNAYRRAEDFSKLYKDKSAEDLIPGLRGNEFRASTPKQDVARLQAFLNVYQNAGLTVDGIYGSRTKAAVKALQDSLGVNQDGFFGSATLAALKKIKLAAREITPAKTMKNALNVPEFKPAGRWEGFRTLFRIADNGDLLITPPPKTAAIRTAGGAVPAYGLTHENAEAFLKRFTSIGLPVEILKGLTDQGGLCSLHKYVRFCGDLYSLSEARDGAGHLLYKGTKIKDPESINPMEFRKSILGENIWWWDWDGSKSVAKFVGSFETLPDIHFANWKSGSQK